MKTSETLLAFAASATLAGCMCSAESVPDNQSVMLCIAKADWPRLIAAMEQFGRANELKLIGGVEPDPKGRPSLNVALAQGYNYYLGDDLDLWITSDPYRPGVINYGAVGRHNPINHEQWQLARALMREIRPLASLAHGTRQEPSCPQLQPTRTPR